MDFLSALTLWAAATRLSSRASELNASKGINAMKAPMQACGEGSSRVGIALGALLVLLVAGSSGCRTGTSHEYNHWKAIHHDPFSASAWNRLEHNFLSYDRDFDGGYLGFLSDEAGDIGTTFRRHFWLDNPENPFLREEASSEYDPPSHHDIPRWREYD
jgi:hypothetical protein